MRLDVLHGKARTGSRYRIHLHEPGSAVSLCGIPVRVSADHGSVVTCHRCHSLAGHRYGIVYVIHFDRPFGHARHYVGWTRDWMSFDLRMSHHRNGSGANLLRHVNDAGIDWHVAGTVYGDRNEERRLKKCGGAARHCPECRVWRATLVLTEGACDANQGR